MTASTDVVIVGAGAAGLAAALELGRAGFNVLLLEARDRIGGRIHTQHPAVTALPIELGAEFVHGRPVEIWRIIKAAGLHAYAVPDTHWTADGGTLVHHDAEWPHLDRVIRAIQSTPGNDRSFKAAAEELWPGVSSVEQAAAVNYVEGFNAALAERMSARAVARTERSGSSGRAESTYRVVGGYDQIVSHLYGALDHSRVAVHLNALVQSIHWQPGRVAIDVRCPGETLALVARHAVITVPFGALAGDSEMPGIIQFTPPLASKHPALNGLEMGHVARMVLQFDDPVWEDPALPINHGDYRLADVSFLHTPGKPFPIWWTTRPLHVPVLTAWAGGTAALKLLAAEEDSRVNAAIDTLASALAVDRAVLLRSLVAHYMHDWSQDPYAGGAYSYPRVGALAASDILAQPLADTLHFAGEATAPIEQLGTVHGALASGERVAREIVGVWDQALGWR